MEAALITEKLGIKQWAEQDRPREKLLAKGKATLSDAELLGILIGTGTKNQTAVDLAMQLLHSAENDLNALAKLNIKELSKIKGIGQAKAITIMAALELGRRRKETLPDEKPILRASKLIYEYIKPIFSDLGHEEFWVLLLRNNLKLIKAEKISSGGLVATVVDLKIILKYAIDNLASAIILCHNHPSGQTEPSQADKNITNKITNACNLLDIRLIDHIIYTEHGYFSFADSSQLT
jgi:DNA repair protein RadC